MVANELDDFVAAPRFGNNLVALFFEGLPEVETYESLVLGYYDFCAHGRKTTLRAARAGKSKMPRPQASPAGES